MEPINQNAQHDPDAQPAEPAVHIKDLGVKYYNAISIAKNLGGIFSVVALLPLVLTIMFGPVMSPQAAVLTQRIGVDLTLLMLAVILGFAIPVYLGKNLNPIYAIGAAITGAAAVTYAVMSFMPLSLEYIGGLIFESIIIIYGLILATNKTLRNLGIWVAALNAICLLLIFKDDEVKVFIDADSLYVAADIFIILPVVAYLVTILGFTSNLISIQLPEEYTSEDVLNSFRSGSDTIVSSASTDPGAGKAKDTDKSLTEEERRSLMDKLASIPETPLIRKVKLINRLMAIALCVCGFAAALWMACDPLEIETEGISWKIFYLGASMMFGVLCAMLVLFALQGNRVNCGWFIRIQNFILTGFVSLYIITMLGFVADWWSLISDGALAVLGVMLLAMFVTGIVWLFRKNLRFAGFCLMIGALATLGVTGMEPGSREAGVLALQLIIMAVTCWYPCRVMGKLLTASEQEAYFSSVMDTVINMGSRIEPDLSDSPDTLDSPDTGLPSDTDRNPEQPG